MLLRILGTSFLGNLKYTGKDSIRADEVTIRPGQEF